MGLLIIDYKILTQFPWTCLIIYKSTISFPVYDYYLFTS